MESFRIRFKKILSSDREIEITGCAKNGYEAIMLASIHKPHVILMDVCMESNMSGIECSKVILKLLPETKVIISSVIEEDQIILKAYEAGVINYFIKKNATPEKVIEAVHAAYQNKSSISPEIAEKLRNELRKMSSIKENMLLALNIVSKLTAGEIDILLLLCNNYSRKEISEMRHIAFSTVKTHINNILTKTNMECSKDLVNLMIESKAFDWLQEIRTKGKEE